MKAKLIGIMLLAILSLALIPAVSAEASLSATILRYEPVPAQPGQYVTVYLQITNTGNDDAENVAVEINNQFPFTPVSSEDGLKELGVIKSQQTYVHDFRLRVDSQAVVGNNQLTVKLNNDGTWQEGSVNIEIKSNDASLSITDVSTEPSELVPGGDGKITLTVKNAADNVLRDIGLQLDLATTATNDLPFIPTSSVTEKKISRLNPGEIARLEFDVKAYPDATPGFYKIPLLMSYFDDQGTETTKTDIIGAIVAAQPDLEVYLEETSITAVGTQGTVNLKFVNKGVHDLKFLEVELIEKDNYKVLSTPKEYIGDLDSDDYRSEEFTIQVDEENVELEVLVSYKDDNNKEYEETINVPLRYNSLTSANGEQKISTASIAIIVLIVIIFIMILRRRKHKRKNK